MTTSDLRCPVYPKNLFARLMAGEGVIIPSDNLIEVACKDCRNAARRNGRPCTRVLHRFTIMGEHVETEIVP